MSALHANTMNDDNDYIQTQAQAQAQAQAHARAHTHTRTQKHIYTDTYNTLARSELFKTVFD